MLFYKLENILVYVIAGTYAFHCLMNHCYCLQKQETCARCVEGARDVQKQDVLSEPFINNNQQASVKNDSFYNETFESRTKNFTGLVDDLSLTNGGFIKLEPLVSDPLIEELSIDILTANFSAVSELNRKRNVRERGLTHEEEMQLLHLHNLYRGNVTPPAGSMAFMEWDVELARLAQEWSDGCKFLHGMPTHNYPDTIGQNLYIGTDPTGQLGLWLWYDEYHHYDLRQQICLPDKTCGHFVQMAWAQSSKLGCGMRKCDLRYLITCHYSPSALRGIQMYPVGKPCSQCPEETGSLCFKNLCLTKEQCKRNAKQCAEAKCNLKCHNCGRLDKENCKCECTVGWDSPDCSKRCIDKHDRCGQSPGWPTKHHCSMNHYAVAEVYCRKMCGKCQTFEENEMSNNVCCKGIFCRNGYVLDMERKPCRCYLLCPGPECDLSPSSGSSLQTEVLWIIMAFVSFKVTTPYL